MGELLHKFPEETSIFGHICRKPANFTPDLGSKVPSGSSSAQMHQGVGVGTASQWESAPEIYNDAKEFGGES